MRRTLFVCLTTLLLLVLTSSSISAQKIRKFKMTNVGGTGSIPLAMELDGEPAKMGLCAGNSNLKGKFTCTTTGWVTRGNWVPSAENCPGGFESIVESNIQNHIIRFADGDLMYWIPDDSKTTFLCAYPDEGKYTITGYWSILGGSGHLKGVTGEATWTAQFDGVPLGPDMGLVGAHDGVVKGTIIYPE